jgi:hypothetical protein
MFVSLVIFGRGVRWEKLRNVLFSCFFGFCLDTKIMECLFFLLIPRFAISRLPCWWVAADVPVVVCLIVLFS